MANNPPIDPRDDAFIREVDEAYREDELKKFARQWGRWVLLAIGLGLAALGGWFFWQHQQNRQVEAVSEQFSEALTKLDSGDSTAAVSALATVGESRNGSYAALAAITQAGIAMNGGDKEKAITALKKVADDKNAAPPFRDAATLKLLRLQFDDLPPADVLKRTAPYTDGDSPWFPVAGEMAALAHLKAGDQKAAGALFLRLAADELAPPSLRARAEQMAAALGEDVTKVVDERVKAREVEQKAAAEATNAAADAAATPKGPPPPNNQNKAPAGKAAQ